MKRSDVIERRAAVIIETIIDLLDEAHLLRRIDQPIEAAVASFHPSTAVLHSHKEVHSIVADFIQHLLRSDPVCPREISKDQALDEAVALLQSSYGDWPPSAYQVAVTDAQNELRGIHWVLESLANGIKRRRRSEYRHWALVSHLDPCDWEIQVAIARRLREHILRDGDPTQLTKAPPAEEMVGQIGQMIDFVAKLRPWP